MLALAKGESCASGVAADIGNSLVCSVNHSEVVSKLIEWGVTAELIRTSLEQFSYRIVDFDAELAFSAGLLRRYTRDYGLSLGDRACLALALRENLPVYTADRRWAELDLNIDIRLVR